MSTMTRKELIECSTEFNNSLIMIMNCYDKAIRTAHKYYESVQGCDFCLNGEQVKVYHKVGVKLNILFCQCVGESYDK